MPQGIIPNRREFRIWRYFWYGVGIAFLAGLAVGIVVTILGAAFGPSLLNASANPSVFVSTFVVGVIVVLVVSVLYLRMALILPAVALDEGLSLSQAWAASSGFSGAILVLALALAFLNVSVSMLLELVLVPVLPQLLSSGISLAFEWFYFMLNISILSTLYGHIVQKREVY